jgi:hypothetical protein
MCRKFTIYGERCSGTNYLESLMLSNFDIDIVWDYGWKHFFGHHNFLNTEEENNTLFIGIIRNPVTWIDSFFKNQHHIIPHKNNIHSFLTTEVTTVLENNSRDKNYVTNKQYKNIFELRFYKNYYLLNIMKNKVKNYILIRYEDLSSSPIKVLTNIKNKFNLSLKKLSIENFTSYKRPVNEKYVKKNIELSPQVIKFILNHINKIQERKLKYI